MENVDVISADTQSLPPYSPARSDYRFDDEYKDKKVSSTARLVRSYTDCSLVESEASLPARDPSSDSTSRGWRRDTWPEIWKTLLTKRQAFALLVLVVFSIAPFVVVGLLLKKSPDSVMFDMAFGLKLQDCNDKKTTFGIAQNSTVKGVEALFVLDKTFGRLSFSQAKVIDAVWDLFMGRGVQLCAWLISYTVFSNAILRLVERHPAPYRMFMRVTMEGPSLNTAWALLVELFKTRGKRTWFLFWFMLLSTLYVLSIPPFLSAMAGYDSRMVPFVAVGEHDNIMPASDFTYGNIITKFPGLDLDDPTCEADRQLGDWFMTKAALQASCDCKHPNGKVISADEWIKSRDPVKTNYWDCDFNYKGQTQVIKSWDNKPMACNQTFPITVRGVKNSVYNISYETGYCYDDKGYYYNKMWSSTRCLPDTGNPSYVWGFSTMIAALFVILQFFWGIAMYFLWQDAQFNSSLVKGGFRITELRAAFALTDAARRETGLNSASLMRHDPWDLKGELFGKGELFMRGNGRGADVPKDIFWNEELEVRRRKGVVEERTSR